MRWWQRLLVTLILAPLLWRLGVAYIASQQGSAWPDLAQQSVGVLASVFLRYTVPALILCAVLLLSDRVLRSLGLDLMTVLVSPLLAFAIARAALALAPAPYGETMLNDGVVSLLVFYGLIWGLTIRERREAGGVPTYRETAA